MRSPTTCDISSLPLTERVLFERLWWFIRIRWLAAVCALFSFIIIRYSFHIVLHLWWAILALIAGIFICNILFYAAQRYLSRNCDKINHRTVMLSALGQICCDLLALFLLTYITGSVENPFIYFFIFHMVIASELLKMWHAITLAMITAAAVNLSVIMQFYGTIPHMHLMGVVEECFFLNPLYLFGVCAVFTLTLFIGIYLSGSIVEQLRRQERHIEKQNTMLAALDEQRAFFMRKASHELKGPLAAMQSMLRVLIDGYKGELTADQSATLERVSQRAANLSNLVKDLVKYSRFQVDAELFQFTDVNLLDVISEVQLFFQPLYQEKRIKIEMAVEEMIVRGERDSLHDLFANLIENAIRYTPPGGRIKLKGCKEGNAFCIAVSDTGIGISPEELPHIFDEYYRAENAKVFESSGTGIGLALVKKIVELHKGSVQVQSQVGAGTTFTIMLPEG